MELPKKLQDEIWDYCRLNKITDIDGFIEKMVKQGFTVEKYGATPTERVVEKEVEKIVEVEVEKPVEVIKEVEKIVEKEVYITDDEATKELTEKITKLQEELQMVSNSKQETINNLTDKMADMARTSTERGEVVRTQSLEIEKLKAELETEKAKPKQQDKKDIYGEDVRGSFGSNLKD